MKTLRLAASDLRLARINRRSIGPPFMLIVERVDSKVFRAVSVDPIPRKRDCAGFISNVGADDTAPTKAGRGAATL